MRIDSSQNIAKLNQELTTKVNANNKELKTLRVLTKQVHEIVKNTVPTQVMSMTHGPLPLSGQFTTNGGTVLMLVSGSGFSAGTNLFIMNITVDGTLRGQCGEFANEINSHKAMPTAMLVFKPAAGSHTVTLSASTNMSTDGNDHFSVAVIEFPV